MRTLTRRLASTFAALAVTATLAPAAGAKVPPFVTHPRYYSGFFGADIDRLLDALARIANAEPPPVPYDPQDDPRVPTASAGFGHPVWLTRPAA